MNAEWRIRGLIRAQLCRVLVFCAFVLSLGVGCSKNGPPPVKVDASPPPRATVIEDARPAPPAPYRAKLPTRGAELYLPTWFSAKHSTYDLVVHFHGLAQWIGWVWPYMAMLWLLSRLSAHD